MSSGVIYDRSYGVQQPYIVPLKPSAARPSARPESPSEARRRLLVRWINATDPDLKARLGRFLQLSRNA